MSQQYRPEHGILHVTGHLQSLSQTMIRLGPRTERIRIVTALPLLSPPPLTPSFGRYLARSWDAHGTVNHIEIESDHQARSVEDGFKSTRVEDLKRYRRHAFTTDIKSLIEAINNMMAALSPKPRLPSPPPFTEVQSGPVSPGLNATTDTPNLEGGGPEQSEGGKMGRIRPGTKAPDMASGPPLLSSNEIESAFQLQEYLKALFCKYTHSPSSEHTTTQLTHESALAIANPPPHADRALWLYELCRLLVIKADQLIVHFFTDSPACSVQTCPEMRASEWQYLCAVHEPPKSCCAIDYCCHTLDWAATTLASQKHFPSRLTLGNDANGGSQAGVRQLTNIMRRVYRIFAHAWFQHRPVFWQVESSEGLYMLFKTVCDVYNLIPEENYTIPPEAEGLAAKGENKKAGKVALKEQGGEDPMITDDADTTTTISTGATTRRHKATPSFSSSVAAIAEGDEDDGKAESPAKEKGGVPIHGASGFSKEAPLAQISKTAEMKDLPAFLEENAGGPPTSKIIKPSVGKEDSGNDIGGDAKAGANQARPDHAVEGGPANMEPVPDNSDTQGDILMEG